jgi:hypothetical protein
VTGHIAGFRSLRPLQGDWLQQVCTTGSCKSAKIPVYPGMKIPGTFFHATWIIRDIQEKFLYLYSILKKTAAISLLLLLLFNLCGYRVWFYYQQQQSDKKLEVSLDKNQYNEKDLITIKIPISLPYQSNWSDFQRVNGEISFNGKIYKYVKRKVWDGQLILLCLPDENKMRLETARDDFFKLANDLMQNNSSKKSGSENLLKNVLSDYDKQKEAFQLNLYTEKISYDIPKDMLALTLPFHNLPEQPPESLSA